MKPSMWETCFGANNLILMNRLERIRSQNKNHGHMDMRRILVTCKHKRYDGGSEGDLGI